MSLTYREVQEQLRLVGVMISKRGSTIRVNHLGGSEGTACYTESLEDAVEAGMKMARPQQLPAHWLAGRR